MSDCVRVWVCESVGMCVSVSVSVHFLCGLMCTWIHESVAELICMRFF